MVQSAHRLWSPILAGSSLKYTKRWCENTKNRKKATRDSKRKVIKKKRTNYWLRYMSLKFRREIWLSGNTFPLMKKIKMIAISTVIVVTDIKLERRKQRRPEILTTTFKILMKISKTCSRKSKGTKISSSKWIRSKRISKSSNKK